MTNEIIGRSGRFSEAERLQIAAIAGAVVPADASLGAPGADDQAILANVLDKVEAQFADRVQAGLEQLGAEVDVAGLEAESVLDLLEGDAGYRSLLQMLTIAIMQAYYQDPRVLALHGLPARPPFPGGHVVEAGDWTLLEPVIERGAVYRPAD